MSDNAHHASIVHVVPARRRGAVGRGLQVLAVIGVVVAVFGATVAWRVVGAVDAIAVDSAAVTAEALTSLESTLDVAADLVASLDGTLTALEDTLVTTSGSLEDGAVALGSVSDLADDAAPALGSATETLRSLESIGTSIDRTLSALSSLPIGPDYDPSESFGTTVGKLADDLDPLADSFATTAEDLQDVGASTDQLREDLDRLVVGIGDADARLDDSAALIAEYRSTAQRAGRTADLASQGLGTDLTFLRLLVLVGCLVLAFGQMVPWLVARALLADAPPPADDA